MFETILDAVPTALYLSRLGALFISLTVHGLAHAAVALALGDNTAREEGYLTLNPFQHTPGISVILGVFVGIGWSKYTPVRPHRARVREKLAAFLITIVGPLSNLGLMFGVLALVNALGGPLYPGSGLPTLREFLTVMVRCNLGVVLINLLPLYPLDMYTLIRYLLPARPAWGWQMGGGRSTYVLAGLIAVVILLPSSTFLTYIMPIVRQINQLVLGW